METGACLDPVKGGADLFGAYTILKRWYWHESARAPNPSRTEVEIFRGGLHTLYQREEPHSPGLPLATHVKPAELKDKIPSEAGL